MKRLTKFIHDVLLSWANELRLIFKDKGVRMFLFVLPLAYPIIYALIYDKEVATDVPIVVVDQCNTPESRRLVRYADASQYAAFVGYASDMADAERALKEKKAYGILLIDKDFSKHIHRGEQAPVSLYSDMSLLIRYRSLLMALTDATQEIGKEIQVETLSIKGADAPKIPATPTNTYIPLGNPQQGFATFLIPGILILIAQQSLLLAICMMGGATYERRRRNHGIDPLDTVRSGAVARIFGKGLVYPVVYIIPLLYLLFIVPRIFSYPQIGNFIDIILLNIPYLLAVTMLGMTLQVFARERESAFVIFVFTSVIFLFLSGIIWPLYNMNPLFKFFSSCCPSTWAMQAFERINANGATLNDVAHEYHILWLQVVVYFFTALATNRYSTIRLKAITEK